MKKRGRSEVARVLRIGRHIGRAPRRTGRPVWFEQMLQRRTIRRILSKLPVSELAQNGVPKRELDKIASFYGSVWELANADRKVLERIPGIGTATLRKVWQALKLRQVNPSWTVS